MPSAPYLYQGTYCSSGEGCAKKEKHTGEQSDISFSHLLIYIAVTVMISDSYENKALV